MPPSLGVCTERLTDFLSSGRIHFHAAAQRGNLQQLGGLASAAQPHSGAVRCAPNAPHGLVLAGGAVRLQYSTEACNLLLRLLTSGSARAGTVVVVLRGLPGCGKSMLAKRMLQCARPEEAVVCSADDFFHEGAGVLSKRQQKREGIDRAAVYRRCFDTAKVWPIVFLPLYSQRRALSPRVALVPFVLTALGPARIATTLPPGWRGARLLPTLF